jgi:nucleoside-diphosphate-sugar epimerase
MSAVLVAGCGYVGSALAASLVADRRTVYGLRRSSAPLPRGVVAIRSDLTALDSIPQLPSEITEVVYCAAAKAHDEATYRAIYIQGYQNLLQALRESSCSISRLVYVSSTGVYGQEEGEVVTEESPTEPDSFSGRVLLEAEERVLRSRFTTMIARFSGIYGPKREGILRQVQDGSAVGYHGRPHYTNRIHLDDCVGILRFLLDAEDSPELRVLIGTDEEAVERNTLLAYLAGCLNVPTPPILPANEAPLRLRGGNKRCSSAKLRSLGYRFVYPTYREGYLSLLRPAAS